MEYLEGGASGAARAAPDSPRWALRPRAAFRPAALRVARRISQGTIRAGKKGAVKASELAVCRCKYGVARGVLAEARVLWVLKQS